MSTREDKAVCRPAPGLAPGKSRDRRQPGGRLARRARGHPALARALAGLLLAATPALAACGPPPPQAPVALANRVASALSEISVACGESYQQHAFSTHPDTSALESEASSRAQELAHVYVRNPRWIYQGQTLAQVVARSASYLRECGLPSAADQLVRLTRAPRMP